MAKFPSLSKVRRFSVCATEMCTPVSMACLDEARFLSAILQERRGGGDGLGEHQTAGLLGPDRKEPSRLHEKGHVPTNLSPPHRVYQRRGSICEC